MSNIGVKVSAAYQAYSVASDNLSDALLKETRAKALEYYRSEQRPIDEAKRERVKAIADQLGECVKKRVWPNHDEMRKWASVLWEI